AILTDPSSTSGPSMFRDLQANRPVEVDVLADLAAHARNHRIRPPLVDASIVVLGQPMWATVAELAKASLAGERGDFDTANALAERAEAELLPNGPHAMLALVQFARGRGAVAHQMYSDGYEQLRRALSVTDIAYHPFLGAWGLSDLIESTVNVGREDEAQDYLLTLESLAAQSQASFLRATLAYAKPILAANGEAESLFQA